MVIVSVLYPATDTSRFDWDYYNAHHLPMVRDAFGKSGMQGVYVLKGLSAADGGPAPFVAIANLTFPDMAAVQATLGGSDAAAVFADIPKFTDIEPVVQMNAHA